MIAEVFKAWFVIGRLGGYNASNLQVGFYHFRRVIIRQLCTAYLRCTLVAQ